MMRNGLPYYKAYPRDFIEGTIGMAFEIKCAYRVILDLIYMQGGKLPDDARYISGSLGCSIRKWNSIRDVLVASGKIQVIGEFLTNKRADKELETLSKLQDNQSQKASKPRKNNDLQEPQLSQPEPEPEPEPKKEKEETTVSSKKRGTRISDDWTPDLAFAESEGIEKSQALREGDKFRDYWKSQAGQKGVRLDWDATYRNWIRKFVDDGKKNGGESGKIPWQDQPEYRGVIV